MVSSIPRIVWWRPICFIAGVAAGAVAAYGAWEYMLRIEGSVTYLVIAVPIIAFMGLFVPSIAEWHWKREETFKTIFWLGSLVAVLAVVFLNNAERLERSKAAMSAETRALSSQAVRARAELEAAEAALPSAEKGEAAAKAKKTCNDRCREALLLAETARKRVEDARSAVFKAEADDIGGSKWTAPPWLLPLALDLIAFMSIWTALSGAWVTKKLESSPATRAVLREAVNRNRDKRLRSELLVVNRSPTEDTQKAS